MQLKVNGNPLDITLENEKTVGDVLASFETEAEKSSLATVEISLNGEKISAEKFDSIISTPLDSSTLIELSVISEEEVKSEFKALSASILEAQKPLLDLSVLLQSGKEKEGAKILSNLAFEMDKFCHISRLSVLFPKLYKSITIEDNSLNDFLESLLPVLKDLKDAMENQDSVTVGDLAEYELTPRLEQLSIALKNIA